MDPGWGIQTSQPSAITKAQTRCPQLPACQQGSTPETSQVPARRGDVGVGRGVTQGQTHQD